MFFWMNDEKRFQNIFSKDSVKSTHEGFVFDQSVSLQKTADNVIGYRSVVYRRLSKVTSVQCDFNVLFIIANKVQKHSVYVKTFKFTPKSSMIIYCM